MTRDQLPTVIGAWEPCLKSRANSTLWPALATLSESKPLHIKHARRDYGVQQYLRAPLKPYVHCNIPHHRDKKLTLSTNDCSKQSTSAGIRITRSFYCKKDKRRASYLYILQKFNKPQSGARVTNMENKQRDITTPSKIHWRGSTVQLKVLFENILILLLQSSMNFSNLDFPSERGGIYTSQMPRQKMPKVTDQTVWWCTSRKSKSSLTLWSTAGYGYPWSSLASITMQTPQKWRNLCFERVSMFEVKRKGNPKKAETPVRNM